MADVQRRCGHGAFLLQLRVASPFSRSMRARSVVSVPPGAVVITVKRDVLALVLDDDDDADDGAWEHVDLDEVELVPARVRTAA